MSIVRNITVSVPDEVYRQARIKAAEQGRSVSSLVAELLAGLAADTDAEFDRRLTLQDEVTVEIDAFRAADRLRRDEIHDRAVRVSGGQRARDSGWRAAVLS